jgi:acyl-CoA synthetase (NDP forming)
MGFPPEQAAAEAERASSVNCQNLLGLAKAYRKPIVGYTYRSLGEPLVQGLIQNGVPVFPDAVRAVRAIQAVVKYGRLRKKLATRK